MPIAENWVPLTALDRDLLVRHIRLTHGEDVTPHRDPEAGHSGHNENPPVSSVTSEGLDSSLSAFRTQNQEASYEMRPGILSNPNPLGSECLSFSALSGPDPFEVIPRTSAMFPFVSPATSLDMSSVQQTSGFGDFDFFIDNINGTYSDGLSSFYVDQPILPSPPAPLFPIIGLQPQSQGSKPRPHPTRVSTPEPQLFDEFTSTLPSFEPSQAPKARKEPWKITQQEWDRLLIEVQNFNSIVPQGFFLPSRHTMTRYITTYFTGFHRHLPFIHLPTFSGAKCPVELILAIATIGAISAFDNNNAIMLFRTALVISQKRLHRRKAQRHHMIFRAKTPPPMNLHPTHIPRDTSLSTEPIQSELSSLSEQTDRFDPLPLVQALLILMAMATWENSEALFDEAVGIQNILVNYVRAEKLLDPQISQGSTWDIWIREEGSRRTVAIIFCFFIFHTIVYDLPPAILNSELNIYLPSREKDWEAQTEEEWQEARRKHEAEPHFQSFFASLFSSQTEKTDGHCSSLGGYTAILGLIQHIYFLQMVAKRRPEGELGIPPADVIEVERALRKWQNEWNQDPESFMGPGSPLGPISFNATALLRMAYIRLNVDLGPWRALNTHDPQEIAISMYQCPPLATSRRVTRAVLYSAHALSIPVKIGVNIVTHNQAFSWSLQHSLCALECAFIISKWLIAIQPHVSERKIDEEEARLYAYIEDMVTEAEAGGEMGSSSTDLCTRVVRIWAKILSGKAHWNVVRMIGQILKAYAQILEQRSL